MDQMMQHLELRPCQGLSRARDRHKKKKKNSSSSGSQNVALAGCDVSYQSDLARVDNLPVVDI